MTRLLTRTQQLQFTRVVPTIVFFKQVWSLLVYLRFVICCISMYFLGFCGLLVHVAMLYVHFAVSQVARHPIPHGQPCGDRAAGLAGPGPGGGAAARQGPGAAAAADSAAGDTESEAKDQGMGWTMVDGFFWSNHGCFSGIFG